MDSIPDLLHHRQSRDSKRSELTGLLVCPPVMTKKEVVVMFSSTPMLHAASIHILLIDDSSSDIEQIRNALEGLGKQITLTVARTLAEGRARLSDFQPDLAIVDSSLPDGNGIGFFPSTREESTFPIVILTSQSDEKEAVEAMRAGALDYLVKSDSLFADMPHILERALREWRHIAERRRAEATLRESERKYRLLFENMTAGFALHEMLYDEKGKPKDYLYLEVNPAFEKLTGIPASSIIGKTVKEVMPNTEQYWIDVFGNVALTGEPISYINFSRELDRYYDTWVFSPGKNQFAVAFTDITERKQAEEALRESEDRWRSVFTNAGAGMIIISHDGQILKVNPGFCRFLGYSEEELLNLTLEEITHPEDRDRTSLHYGEIYSGQREVLHYEKRYLRKDGRVVWGHASVACVLNTDNQAIYCIGLVQDITDRVIMEEALRKANRELDAFVHTVSHDLRTPLTPIIGYAELLQVMYRENLDDQALDFLAEIGRQGERMLSLLEDLLSLARVGFLDPPAEPVEVNEVLQETLIGLGSLLAETGMTLEAGLLPHLRVPKTVLLQVFDNLISNAIRYAGPGGSIEVQGERRGVRVRFSVRDHGPGIPEEERGRVFDLFYRGSTSEELEGTGVGLASVQKIARLYGGQAWVEETPGGGCTFWVEMIDGIRQEAD